jgi:hypothetical protein
MVQSILMNRVRREDTNDSRAKGKRSTETAGFPFALPLVPIDMLTRSLLARPLSRSGPIPRSERII